MAGLWVVTLSSTSSEPLGPAPKPCASPARGARPAPMFKAGPKTPPKQHEIGLGAGSEICHRWFNERATLRQLQQRGRHSPKTQPGRAEPARMRHYSPLEIKIALTGTPQRSSIYYYVFQQVQIHLVNNAGRRAHRSAAPAARRRGDALASITRRRRNKSAGILLSQD